MALLMAGAVLSVLITACGAGDNGGTIQTPPSTPGGSVSTSTTAPGSTLPGGD